MTVKESAIQLIQEMPDDVTLDDILYRLFVRQKVERGLAQVEAGETLTHEEVKERLKKWLV